jgi:signal transduction histidine kinase
MTATTHPSHPAPYAAGSELALRLAHAEAMLRTLTSGQVDAIVSPDGKIYLLQPAEAAPPKDRFLAMLSHELRTPLMPVLLGVDELGDDERFAAARPTLTMMRRNIEVQSRLLEELTDFTTVGQHKVRLRPEAIDAHEAVRYVLEICRGESGTALIEVRLDLRASESIVLADSVRLQQIMWNLLKNAIKFSPPGGDISITSANETPGNLTLEFTDHGIGIEPEFLPLLFEAFQQGANLPQHRHGGLGLGMFIAKELAEAQGGTLTVASEGRGKGATFRLTLNLAPNQTQE